MKKTAPDALLAPTGHTPQDRLPPNRVPIHCPRCGKKETEWMSYRHIPEAPACGCVWCGVVLYLTEKPSTNYFRGTAK